MVVQRLINVERQLRLQAEAAAAGKAEEVARLKGELTVLQVQPMVQMHPMLHFKTTESKLGVKVHSCMPATLLWGCLSAHTSATG